MNVNWECPYCGRPVTLTKENYTIDKDYLYTSDAGTDGSLNYRIFYIVCPNQECKKYTIRVTIHKRVYPGGGSDAVDGELILDRMLVPKGGAKPYPDYIPATLRQDYEEAYLILDDSPKASATLARRCLQGLIRQYFNITKNTLYEEIKELEGVLAPDLWKAVDSIREVGNVGAHSEKDVDKIVDVPLRAAHALIQLIELLFEETYIKEKHRQERIQNAITAAEGIKQADNENDDAANQNP